MIDSTQPESSADPHNAPTGDPIASVDNDLPSPEDAAPTPPESPVESNIEQDDAVEDQGSVLDAVIEETPDDTAADDVATGEGANGEPVGEKPKRKRRGGEVESEAARVLEALLFSSGEILTPAKLKGIVPGDPDARKLRSLVDKINGELQSQRHPFQIVDVAGGYQFRTVPYYSPWVRQLLKEKAAKRLSIQALECLAIIAYRQPITRAEIESIRGTLSDGAMKTLLERRMVTITGRSEKAGRPLLYGTTKEFLSYFGLRDIDELPRIEEFETMAKDKMGDIAQELEQMQQERAGTSTPLSAREEAPLSDRADEDPRGAGAEGAALSAREGETPLSADDEAHLRIVRDDEGVARQTAENLDDEPSLTSEDDGAEQAPEDSELGAEEGASDTAVEREHEQEDEPRDNPPESETEPR